MKTNSEKHLQVRDALALEGDTVTKNKSLKEKLQKIANLIPIIGRQGKANWIFFDSPKLDNV